MMATVLGASGFVGRYLAQALSERGDQCWTPERGNRDVFNRKLGCVYYCIGLTADFRSRPLETVDAHVGVLRDLLEYADFDQLIYLSSTRVYAGGDRAEEDRELLVASHRPGDLYNLSKLMGESMALSSGRDCRIVRLSNIVGAGMGGDNFIGALIREARETGRVRLRSAPTSEKDYLGVASAVEAIMAIADKGQSVIYNVASGQNVTNALVAGLFEKQGIPVSIEPGSPEIRFPQIAIERVAGEVGWSPPSALAALAELIKCSLQR